MSDSFMPVLNVEAVIWALDITFSTTSNYQMAEQDKESIRRLVSRQPFCTAYWLYRAISMLARGANDEIPWAIAQVALVCDPEILGSPQWWANVEALKAYDELSSREVLIQ